MATTAFVHSTSAPTGLKFRLLDDDPSNRVSVVQGTLFAVMGTALGLLAGTAAALGPWSTNPAAQTQNSAQVSASAASSGGSADQNTLRFQSIQSQVNRLAAGPAAPVLVRASLETTVPHHAAVARVHHVSVNPIVNSDLQSASEAESGEPAAPVAAAMADVTAPATSDNASRPASTVIEGDLTVADFDALTGTVETREGRNFSVTQAGSDSNTSTWQDYAGNVHYRCTQGGSCTLRGSGVAASATLL